MFGLDKLMAMKKQAEEIKERLNHISVDAASANGQIQVTATGNRQIKQITIADELLTAQNREELEEMLALACNRALEKAEKLAESEMRSLLPGLGGLGL